MATDSVHVTKVEDLVEHLELVKLHTYELVATALDEYEKDESDDSEDALVEAGEEQIRVRTGVRMRSRAVDYRVEFLVSHAYGRLVADIGAFYKFQTTLDLDADSDGAVIEFGDRVALMVLYPYLRQAISDLGQRVGVEITLPMLRPGNISFGPDEEVDDAEF